MDNFNHHEQGFHCRFPLPKHKIPEKNKYNDNINIMWNNNK